MSSISAGLVKTTNLTVTGTQAGAVTATNLDFTNLSIPGSLSVSGNLNINRATFEYSVASGDPLADRVIIWTRAKIPNVEKPVSLTWVISDTSNLSHVVNSGSITVDYSTDYCAKVDASGLTAGTDYYYQFTDSTGAKSDIGTARTLPATGISQVKFAFFSCTHYSAGYFNAYRSIINSDVKFAIHLGDYLYEYASGQYADNSARNNRQDKPGGACVTLADYRARYANYRSDPDLKELHRIMPWITIWDDHEFADNANLLNAENHNGASAGALLGGYTENSLATQTQGNFGVRKNNAARVYREWMPIRVIDVDVSTDKTFLKIPFNIYRKFDFGDLFSLHMLDTRMEGRDKQYAYYGDTAYDSSGRTGYNWSDYLTGVATGTDASRNMISNTQFNWLTNNISSSSAIWQLIGNQTVMAKFAWPSSFLAAAATQNPATIGAAGLAYCTASATPDASRNQTQKDLLNPSLNPLLPNNLDNWDGYPSQRDRLFRAINATGKKATVLSGDIHSFWFNRLKTTDNSIDVGYEAVSSSITAPGYGDAGFGALGPLFDGSVLGAGYGTGYGVVRDVLYDNLNYHGWVKMTITPSNIVTKYVYVNNIASTTYTEIPGATVTVDTSYNVSFS